MSMVTALPRLFAASSKDIPRSRAVSLVKLVNWNSVSCSSKVCSNASYSPMLLVYPHNCVPACFPPEDTCKRLRQLLKADLVPDVAEKPCRLVVSRQSLPDRAPQFHWAEDRIDAEQVDSAQNKRENACAEIDSSCIAKGCNRAAISCGTDQV